MSLGPGGSPGHERPGSQSRKGNGVSEPAVLPPDRTCERANIPLALNQDLWGHSCGEWLRACSPLTAEGGGGSREAAEGWVLPGAWQGEGTAPWGLLSLGLCRVVGMSLEILAHSEQCRNPVRPHQGCWDPTAKAGMWAGPRVVKGWVCTWERATDGPGWGVLQLCHC